MDPWKLSFVSSEQTKMQSSMASKLILFVSGATSSAFFLDLSLKCFIIFGKF